MVRTTKPRLRIDGNSGHFVGHCCAFPLLRRLENVLHSVKSTEAKDQVTQTTYEIVLCNACSRYVLVLL